METAALAGGFGVWYTHNNDVYPVSFAGISAAEEKVNFHYHVHFGVGNHYLFAYGFVEENEGKPETKNRVVIKKN